MNECAAVLEQPALGFQFPKTGLLSTSPFTLNGAPMRNHPQSIKGITENARTKNALTNPHDPNYFDSDNYYSFNVQTENIIPSDHSTELRYHELNLTYSLSFIAIHRNIWDIRENGAFQVSLFFLGDNNQRAFHICIPVQYIFSNDLVNPFLRAWLNPDSALPNPFTVNHLFDFGIQTNSLTDPVNFSLTQYCLKYNQGRSSFKTYHLCLFQTPIKVNQNNLPEWLANDLYLQKKYAVPAEGRGVDYRRLSFDEILNQQLAMMISSFATNGRPEPLVSKDIYFDTFRKQNVFTPVFFSVEEKELIGVVLKPRRTEGFTEGFTQRVLENVKCYPVDLKTQVGQDGKINVNDQNQPISLGEAASLSGGGYAASLEQKRASDNIIYYISFAIIGIIALIIIIALVVIIFKGRTTNIQDIREAAAIAAKTS